MYLVGHQVLGTGHLNFPMGTHSIITLGGDSDGDGDDDDDYYRNAILHLKSRELGT